MIREHPGREHAQNATPSAFRFRRTIFTSCAGHRFAFETRDDVDAILQPVRSDAPRCLGISTQALASLLNQMVGAIPADVALHLAFEIINGMAKTAPMTKHAFAAGLKSPPP